MQVPSQAQQLPSPALRKLRLPRTGLPACRCPQESESAGSSDEEEDEGDASELISRLKQVLSIDDEVGVKLVSAPPDLHPRGGHA